MKEFVNNHKNHVDEAFNDFEVKHNKKYQNEHHRENRKDIFTQARGQCSKLEKCKQTAVIFKSTAPEIFAP